MTDLHRLGKYEIRRPLGQGAMGTVYLAFDPDIERLVALKTIGLHAAVHGTAESFVARFRNEAKAAGRLTHPHIVGVYEYGADRDVAFIAMEFVEGHDLHTYVRGRVGFDFEQALSLADQLLDALEFAHRHGVVHRDIKPTNLMVTRDGTLKVADFGIAHMDTSKLTATGMIVGTPSYMSPEQCMGGAVDARSDLFSVGVLLYELVTGERPFTGSPEAIAYKICHENPVAPSQRAVLRVPSGMDQLIGMALAKDPAQRFANAHTFRTALQRLAVEGVTRGETDQTRNLETLLSRTEASPAPNNLPYAVSSFIGRDSELDDVTHLLRGARLVTVVGAGGLGKTRFAVELARARLREHVDGVWLIELAAVADPRLVIETTALTLGVKAEPGQTLQDALLRHVSTRALLLILDNCEHLLSACADVIKRLLSAGRDIKIIATSREPLHVGGETVYSLHALGIPKAGATRGADSLRAIASVQLFCDRAEAIDPEFALSDSNAVSVADICERLDGIPLALELAAARVRALPVESIAARLGDRFRLLKGGDRAALPRQQTLRATIDWSHDLLTASQQTLLRRLAVFSGGFTLDAAEAVCGGGDIDQSDVLDLLADLVEKSLVVRDPKRDRYGLLETVRQYAREKLEAAGEDASVQERHLLFYLALAEQGDPEHLISEQDAWNARLDRERDNLAAAHAFCDGAPDGGQLGLRLVHALRNWLRRGSLELACEIIKEALARPGAATRNVLRCRALFTLAVTYYFAGRYADAVSFADDSQAIARDLSDELRVADALAVSGLASFGAGDLDRSKSDLVTAVEIGRRLGHPMRLQQALNCLAEVQSSVGEIDAARANYEEALALAKTMGSRDLQATTLLNLVRIELAQGDVAKAAGLLQEALPHVDASGLASDGQQFLTIGSGLAAHRGQWERAARLYGVAQAWLDKSGARREPADESFIAPLVARTREMAGADSFDDAESSGRRLSIAAALVEMQDWLATRDE